MSEERTFTSKTWRRTTIIAPLIVAAITGVAAMVYQQTNLFSSDKPDKTEEIKSILVNYANDLNNEELNAYKYFSNSVDAFINLTGTEPNSINNSLKNNYYPHYLHHRVQFNINELKIEEKGDEYIVELTEEDSYVWYKTKEEKKPKYHVKIRFDEDLKIKSFIQKQF